MTKSDEEGLYEVPQDYEAFWGARGDDWPWYQAQVQSAHRILDLATGTGRLALLLAGQGLEVCGVDASQVMLDVARARGLDQGLAVDWRQGDLRALDLDRVFDLALLPYNGLQHLCGPGDTDAFFAGLRAGLKPGARLALDLHLPRPEILARDPDEWFGVEEPGTSPSGWSVLAEQSRWDPFRQVLTQRWRLGDRQGAQRMLALELRQFFPQELRRLLGQAGFEILGHWGGFQGQAVDAQAVKQVLLARLAR